MSFLPPLSLISEPRAVNGAFGVTASKKFAWGSSATTMRTFMTGPRPLTLGSTNPPLQDAERGMFTRIGSWAGRDRDRLVHIRRHLRGVVGEDHFDPTILLPAAGVVITRDRESFAFTRSSDLIG